VAHAEPVLGVIIPAFNEERSIELVVRRVLQEPSVEQVVIVDDCSTDGTLAAARRCASDPRVTVKHQPANQGKGAAIRLGLEAIKSPIVIIQDADLEYDPGDYSKLISPIMRGRADVVYGTRGFAGHSAYSYWFVVGNQLVTTATNILFNCYIQDMGTGYKVMRTPLMRRLGLRGNRFDIEPEITGRILRLGYRIYEIPIDYAARTREQGKKLTWRDGVGALFVLLRIRLMSARRLFGQPDPYHQERLNKLSASLTTGRGDWRALPAEEQHPREVP
jgi:glycosyltransferase involved in cell wall biosynthesis